MTAVELSCELHGHDVGTPLVLAGSLGTTRRMWDPQLMAFAAERCVVAFDMRGHGGSPVPPGPYSIADLGADVIALLDRLALDRVDWCGLSIGGMVGQWLAIHAPERIASLALLCTAPDTLNPDTFTERAATVRAAGTPAVVAEAVVGGWFTEPFAVSHPDVVTRCRDAISRCDAEGYASCAEAVAGHDVAADLQSITAPTLVVSGAQDRAIPAAQGERIAAAIPGARFELLDPAAHLASVERPDAVTELVSAHLDAAGGGP